MAATNYSVAPAITDTLNIAFAARPINQTFNVKLAGTDTALSGLATVDYNGRTNDINKTLVTSTGSDNINLNGATNKKTVTITGSDNNKISLGGANALSSTSAMDNAASAATGDNLIDCSSNISTDGVTVNSAIGNNNTVFDLIRSQVFN